MSSDLDRVTRVETRGPRGVGHHAGCPAVIASARRSAAGSRATSATALIASVPRLLCRQPSVSMSASARLGHRR
jgi:hypothetical protein